jgi:hypothetical protein
MSFHEIPEEIYINNILPYIINPLLIPPKELVLDWINFDTNKNSSAQLSCNINPLAIKILKLIKYESNFDNNYWTHDNLFLETDTIEKLKLLFGLELIQINYILTTTTIFKNLDDVINSKIQEFYKKYINKNNL